ncbi:MAG: hypothetical protein QOF57_2061 [Frankiaceae bacterium]|jgi:hypothetical protein|nr:hypothetical protein [Frankiaceae bacterium]MDQ1726362.1 hypothetical protein [Frankiaceae bacterium]
MTTPFDSSTDGLSPEEQRVADHRDLTPQERQTPQDYVGSGNDARSSAPRAAGEPADDGTDIGDRTEPGDGGLRTSAHRPAAGIPEGADPAQRPLEGTSEEFPVAEGARPGVQLDEPVRRHGESDPGSPAAAAGTVPDAMNEHTVTDNPYPASTWERPVTGVHRPSAPEGEVAAE